MCEVLRMFCTHCGAKLDLSHNFCSKCGTPVANPMPPQPKAPPPPDPNPEEDGDEAVLYRNGHAVHYTGPDIWVVGAFVIARGYIVFYPHRLIRTFRVLFRDIEAISDAYVTGGTVRFSVRTKDGRTLAFSVDTVELADTQTVVEQLRYFSGVSLVFWP